MSSCYRADLLVSVVLVLCREAIPQQAVQPPSKSVGDAVPGQTWVDTGTGLMWKSQEYKQDPSRVIFDRPQFYCENLRLNGLTGWRLPTITEVRTLYAPSFQSDLQPEPYSHVRDEIKLTSSVVWSRDLEKYGASLYSFDFQSGASKYVDLVGVWAAATTFNDKIPGTLCVREATQSQIAEQRKQDILLVRQRELEVEEERGTTTERKRPNCLFRSLPPKVNSKDVERAMNELLNKLNKGEASTGTTWTERTCYGGPNSEWVQRLLDRAGPWNCPWHVHKDEGSPPRVGTESGSFRDQYVMAAVLEAWAAECYTRIRRDDVEATAQGLAMMDSLRSAENLCNQSVANPSPPVQPPLTFPIYHCGELSSGPPAGASATPTGPLHAPSAPEPAPRPNPF
jgi:hypothetical protein